MKTRFRLFVLLTVVLLVVAAAGQSAPPSPEAAPAPGAPASAPVTAPAPGAPASGPVTAPAPAAPGAPASPRPVVAPTPRPPIAEPLRHFQLDYVLKEVENGKVTNSRSFSIIVAANGEGRPQQIRNGSQVPVSTTGPNGPILQYMDVGVDIDSSDVRERQGQLSLRVSANISSVASKPDTSQPIIRRNRWDSVVTVPIGKPIVIFSSDDVVSTRTMQLELKATPIKQ